MKIPIKNDKLIRKLFIFYQIFKNNNIDCYYDNSSKKLIMYKLHNDIINIKLGRNHLGGSLTK